MQTDSSAVEVLPEFPDGIKGYYKYINKNFHYPKSALKATYMGQTIVKFIVEKDGTVKVDSLNNSKMFFQRKNVKEELKNTAIKEIEIEIIRVFESMPKWKPGIQNGKNVRVFFTTPYNMYFE